MNWTRRQLSWQHCGMCSAELQLTVVVGQLAYIAVMHCYMPSQNSIAMMQIAGQLYSRASSTSLQIMRCSSLSQCSIAELHCRTALQSYLASRACIASALSLQVLLCMTVHLCLTQHACPCGMQAALSTSVSVGCKPTVEWMCDTHCPVCVSVMPDFGSAGIQMWSCSWACVWTLHVWWRRYYASFTVYSIAHQILPTCLTATCMNDTKCSSVCCMANIVCQQ